MMKHAYGYRVFLYVLLVLLVVSRYSADAREKECIDCHSAIHKQFSNNSHHVQGVTLSGKHCYACHWEATSAGKINSQYHEGRKSSKSKTSNSTKIDLVIWSTGARPTEYKQNMTAVIFNSASIGGKSERSEVTKITNHCLSCHNESNGNTLPFIGDKNTPQHYAWDKMSISSRYSQKGLTAWGKYSTAATNRKSQIIKAFSAHGNSASNVGGWSSESGYDGNVSATRGGVGAKNVECFDCHNSHGSSVTGITSSYRTLEGTTNGGILKETVSGRGGYDSTYTPSSNLDAASENPYNPGAGLCFDCHETAKSGVTPWGYSSTFGASQPIVGYKDTMHFASGVKGSTSRFSNRHSRIDVASSHFKAGNFVNYSTTGKINGLCTPCHDPHGVSLTLGDKMPYAVPLLKGTWLTSPYREDGPPSGLKVNNNAKYPPKKDYNSTNRSSGANFGKGESSAPRSGDYNSTNRSSGANFGKGES
ncbi:MAG: cytochrome c3 family protein, partial [Desulfuromonadaceae bacterium]|nr:cytochrome c3 family protein [Desulfuromonadaceae bacterium]MDD2854346.1 cytochrome c3 family protein [Desulfuromonadaceae bacterium]